MTSSSCVYALSRSRNSLSYAEIFGGESVTDSATFVRTFALVTPWTLNYSVSVPLSRE